MKRLQNNVLSIWSEKNKQEGTEIHRRLLMKLGC